MVGRRGFLWLCAASGVGIGLAGTGLWLYQRRTTMVPRWDGPCSFCGKGRHELFGLVGAEGKPARICDECAGMCHAFLTREAATDARRASLRRRRYPTPPHVLEAHCSFCDRSRREAHKIIAGPRVFICDACSWDATGVLTATRRA
jgi:hypothetical protein